MNRGRLGALVALGLVAAGLVATVLVTVPWQHLPGPHVQRPSALARDFTSDEINRSRAFDQQTTPFQYASLVAGLALAVVLGLTPLGARFIGATARIRRGWGWQVLFGAVGIVLLGRIVSLPFDIPRETALRRFGLSTQTWGSWAADQIKGFALSAVLIVLVAVVVYAMIRAAPRTWWGGRYGDWWLPAAVGGFALALLLSFAYPVVVEPVFNKFRPMGPTPLRSDLLTLAKKDRVPVSRVLVADASRRTTSLNAYVSGFGSTHRIVVYDTLLRSASPRQVELVVAHELGHAEEQDVLHGTVIGGLATAGAVCLIYLVVSRPGVQRRAGVTTLRDPRSLALLLMAASVLSILSGPAQNMVSRQIENRADQHALDLTRDPEAFAEMQRALAVRNISDLEPSTIEYLLFFNHPTTPQRIAVARDWARDHDRPMPPPLRENRNR